MGHRLIKYLFLNLQLLTLHLSNELADSKKSDPISKKNSTTVLEFEQMASTLCCVSNDYDLI